MAKKDFDNLMLLVVVRNVLTAGTSVSTEVDFEIPRGYIVKIFKIIFKWIDWHEDLDGLTSTTDIGVDSCLLRDPDDTGTVRATSNAVNTDVVAQFHSSMYGDVDAGSDFVGMVIGESESVINIPEHVDLITARNMRFNTVGLGGDVAVLTESQVACHIYYTLEKVTDDTILNLLDIL